MEKVWRAGWVLCVCAVCLVFLAGCSAHRSTPNEPVRDGRVSDPFASDPFDDPFFSSAPAWDAAVLQHSQIISQHGAESADGAGVAMTGEEESTLEKGQNIVFSSVLVGTSVARLLLVPFLFPPLIPVLIP